MHIGFWRGNLKEKEDLLGRPGRIWENNIRMDLKDIGWEGIDWIDLAEDKDKWQALVNTAMNIRFPHFFSNGATAHSGPGPHCRGFTITDTPHSVGLLWTREQPDAETST